jgi:hypothetical protein
MLTGYLGSCNLNLAGNQNNTSIWSSCVYRGLYTLAYRRCTCFCQFCNCNFSQEQALNSSDTIPYYNTDISNLPTNSGWVNAGARNTGYPYMWNLIPNVVSGTGTVTINVTSPRSISKSTPIYGYELSEFSLNSTNMTMNCILSSGAFFQGWRANSSAGTQCSTNLSFSPGYNTSYSDKKGTTHYKNIYQFYASATFL